MSDAVSRRSEVVARLVSAQSSIRALGVRRLALFGSFVRDEARGDSDVDVLVEFEPGRKNFDAWLDLGELLELLLGRHVDLVSIDGLSPFIGPHILAEAVDVVRAA